MKPAFALTLSFEGITLLHRAAGGWRQVGSVDLDAPDLADALGRLRKLALRLEPDLRCKLILPNDQIRYLTVDTGPFRGEARLGVIEQAVAGATPYRLDELVWDTSPEGAATHVAIVARETLAEAEAFAEEHGFHPVSFVAIPEDNPFLGEPFFGPTSAARDLTGSEAVDPDGIAVVVIGEAVVPDIEPDPLPPAGVEPSAPMIGFSTRRGKPDDDEPARAPAPASGVTETASAADRAKDAAPETVAATDTGVQSRRPARNDGDAPRQPSAPGPKPVTSPVAQPVTEEMPTTGFGPAVRSSQVPKTEADRLTIFGARKGGVGGKPRYLGIALTVSLLLFLAGVAAFAAFVVSGGMSGFSERDMIAVPVAPEPEPPQVEEQPNDPPATEEPEASPGATSAPSSIDEDPVDLNAGQSAPPLPALSGADDAVLHALQTDPRQVEELDFEPEPETATRETDDGVLFAAPDAPEVPGLIGLGDLFVASIDRTDLFHDAVALPNVTRYDTDDLPEGSNAPASAGQSFAFDDRGLVEPSPEGTLNPDGVLVYAGRPDRVPPAPPVRFEAAPEPDPAQERLASKRPKARPDDLIEQAERAQFGGRSRTELASLRPRARPASIQEQFEAEQATEPEDTVQEVSPLAVTTARKPRPRPENLTIAASAANSNPGSLVNPSRGAGAEEDGDGFVAATVKPKAPSPTSVARQATLDNAINLRDLNLIGVYGTPSNRRALVRLPSGRYKKVKVGDTIDGGRITAIGDSELRYQKGSRNLTLKIPSG
ncbi:hypothetical protein [Ruegeria marina]|uniref:Type IV pilus biogenesis protein PilP n=1 Tax=Ruegeria marina TaxID=639004 RepID=A0A1G6Z2J1_9RHOB|nr:hypothetical protein [Ruegeria marina]SDD96869.1 hypothetical protein SAMN04488239_11278 [Ruegeria marina]